MAAEAVVARESRVRAVNAISSSTGSRRDKAIREFAERRRVYEAQLRAAEERYTYAPTNREMYAAEKEVERINFRIREIDSNINYMRRFGLD